VIFYRNDAQHQTALASKAALEATHRFPQVVTVIEPEKPFYRAEEYHQKYAEKNPLAYAAYRTGCRRDARTAEIWGK
jgi:peptide methionine sulfoxide reductase MsrA